MEIKNVKLHHIPAITEAVDENGLGQPLQDELFSFEVVKGNDEIVIVPNDSTNANYWHVKEWYDSQKKKPFKFTFEKLAEPDFAETVYPPTREEIDDFLHPTTDEADDELESEDTEE